MDDLEQADQDDKILADVATFMHDKGVTLKCSMCDQTEAGWAVYAPYPYTPTIPFGNKKGTLVIGDVVPTLSARCRNCGFIRMFDMEVFEEWRANRDAA